MYTPCSFASHSAKCGRVVGSAAEFRLSNFLTDIRHHSAIEQQIRKSNNNGGQERLCFVDHRLYQQSVDSREEPGACQQVLQHVIWLVSAARLIYLGLLPCLVCLPPCCFHFLPVCRKVTRLSDTRAEFIAGGPSCTPCFSLSRSAGFCSFHSVYSSTDNQVLVVSSSSPLARWRPSPCSRKAPPSAFKSATTLEPLSTRHAPPFGLGCPCCLDCSLLWLRLTMLCCLCYCRRPSPRVQRSFPTKPCWHRALVPSSASLTRALPLSLVVLICYIVFRVDVVVLLVRATICRCSPSLRLESSRPKPSPSLYASFFLPVRALCLCF